jgi:hypothetical protein
VKFDFTSSLLVQWGHQETEEQGKVGGERKYRRRNEGTNHKNAQIYIPSSVVFFVATNFMYLKRNLTIP